MKNFSLLYSPEGDGVTGGGGGVAVTPPPAGAAAVAAGGGTAAGAETGAAAAATTTAATQTPAPWYSDFFKPDGSINRDSFSRMPENYRKLADGDLKTVSNAEQFFAKFDGLSRMAGRKALAPLPANATPEDIAAHQQVMRAVNGVPEKPDGYGFAKPAELPEGAWDQNFATEAQALLHKHNASPALAKELLAMNTKAVMTNLEAQKQYEADFYKQQDNEFRTELQKGGLDYDKTMTMVNRVATNFGLPVDSPIMKNAGVRMLLNKVGIAMGEAKFVGGASGAVSTASDKSVAEDIIHNKQNPEYEAYWKPDHAKHADTVKKVNALFASHITAQKAAQAGGSR